jgi:tetratricopeptide (TPR) repeat protein
MKADPTDASAPFNLGNMLRGAARTVEAEAALRAATRADPAFAQAWYNLADLLDDQGRVDAAIESLRKALVVAGDYTDALFNLALLLQRRGSYAEAKRLLAPISSKRRCLRMGRTGAAIVEVLRDPDEAGCRRT